MERRVPDIETEESKEGLRNAALDAYASYVETVWMASKEPSLYEFYDDRELDDPVGKLAEELRGELISNLRGTVTCTMMSMGFDRLPLFDSPELADIHEEVKALTQSFGPEDFIYEGELMWDEEEGLPNPLVFKHNITRVVRTEQSRPIPPEELMDRRDFHPLIKQRMNP